MGAVGTIRTCAYIRYSGQDSGQADLIVLLCRTRWLYICTCTKQFKGLVLRAIVTIFSAVAHAWTKENRVSRSGHA